MFHIKSEQGDDNTFFPTEMGCPEAEQEQRHKFQQNVRKNVLTITVVQYWGIGEEFPFSEYIQVVVGEIFVLDNLIWIPVLSDGWISWLQCPFQLYDSTLAVGRTCKHTVYKILVLTSGTNTNVDFSLRVYM